MAGAFYARLRALGLTNLPSPCFGRWEASVSCAQTIEGCLRRCFASDAPPEALAYGWHMIDAVDTLEGVCHLCGASVWCAHF